MWECIVRLLLFLAVPCPLAIVRLPFEWIVAFLQWVLVPALLVV